MSTFTVLPDGKIVGTVFVNPTVTEVLYNEQPLPEGSVVRNSTTGQKFIKTAGSSTSFVAIEISPPPAWVWSQDGIDAWAILQGP